MKGLIGWWRLNGNTNDYSGKGNTGTNHGAALATDRFGNANLAYSFGNGIYIDCGNSANLNVSTIFSIAAWFYPTSNSHYQPIVAKMNSSSAGWEVANSTGTWRATTRNGLIDISGGSISLNTWHFITATHDGSILRLYGDGTLLNSAGGVSLLDSTNNLLIGRRGLDTSYYDGSIGEVRMYNRALSALEVKALYKLTANDFSSLFSAFP